MRKIHRGLFSSFLFFYFQLSSNSNSILRRALFGASSPERRQREHQENIASESQTPPSLARKREQHLLCIALPLRCYLPEAEARLGLNGRTIFPSEKKKSGSSNWGLILTTVHIESRISDTKAKSIGSVSLGTL